MNKPETGITPEVKQALVSVSLLSVFILVMSSIFGGIFLSCKSLGVLETVKNPLKELR